MGCSRVNVLRFRHTHANEMPGKINEQIKPPIHIKLENGKTSPPAANHLPPQTSPIG
jgi:hypothetical protein